MLNQVNMVVIVIKLSISLVNKNSLPDNLLSEHLPGLLIVVTTDFIEIKIHYHGILDLMPKDYHQTLNILQSFITDDELASILETDNPDVANKKILNCLIEKMKYREQMLDLCDQIEKVITSKDLKTITDEIRRGKLKLT